MSVRNFIQASSLVLIAWLGATYFHHVPAERYIQSHSAAAEAGSSKQDAVTATVANDPVTR